MSRGDFQLTKGLTPCSGRGKIFERLVEAGLPQVGPVRMVITSLLTLWRQVSQELKQFDREIERVAKASAVCQRLMTVPGVGPITAVAYATTIDNPARFTHSTEVGEYLGLTPRRYQSGEVDRPGPFRNVAIDSYAVYSLKPRPWSWLGSSSPPLSKRGGCASCSGSGYRKLAWRSPGNWRCCYITSGSPRHGSVQLPAEHDAQTRLAMECVAGMPPGRRLNHPETRFTA